MKHALKRASRLRNNLANPTGASERQSMLDRIKRWARWKQRLFWGAVSLAAILVVIGSEAVQNCIEDYKHHYGESSAHSSLGLLGFVLGAMWRCAGEFLHANGELLVAGGTIVLAYYTYWLWRDASEGSARTLEHLKESSERQERAYITVAESGVWPDEFGDTGRLYVTLRNTGQTPAYRLSGAPRKALVPTPELKTFNFSVKSTEGAGTDTMLGPNCTYTVRVRFTKDELTKVRALTHRLFIFGRVTYVDAFGQTRYTNYRHYWALGDLDAKNLPRSNEGNDGN